MSVDVARCLKGFAHVPVCLWSSAECELVEAALPALLAENDRLRHALDWIECEPEDPVKVQLWARAALAARPDGEADG